MPAKRLATHQRACDWPIQVQIADIELLLRQR
jgi:hypothetical protein